MKILVMGLPGAGKTTLARALVARLGAVHLNADEMRANINKDLGFSIPDRLEQARRLGWLSERIAQAGVPVVADFVCPTPETRTLFGKAFIIWLDRISESRFADTNRLFTPPERYDVRVGPNGTAEEWAISICETLQQPIEEPEMFVVDANERFDEPERLAVMHSVASHGQACIVVVGSPKVRLDQRVEARIEALFPDCSNRLKIVRATAIKDLRGVSSRN